MAASSLATTARLLALRRELPVLFRDGAYAQIAVRGPHTNEMLAFARVSGRDAATAAAGRCAGRNQQARCWPGGDAWQASVSLEGFASVHNMLEGERGGRARGAGVAAVRAQFRSRCCAPALGHEKAGIWGRTASRTLCRPTRGWFLPPLRRTMYGSRHARQSAPGATVSFQQRVHCGKRESIS